MGSLLEYLNLTLTYYKDQGEGRISTANISETCNPLHFAVCQRMRILSRHLDMKLEVESNRRCRNVNKIVHDINLRLQGQMLKILSSMS